MFDFNITYDSYGGKDADFQFMFDSGLLRRDCPKCGRRGKIEYVKNMEFPRLRCRCGYRQSCKNGTVLGDNNVGDIPLFLFVVKCFVLRVSTTAIVELSCAHEDTIHHYLKIIRDVLCAHFDEEVRNPNFMFGGEGKIVEVDEAFICRAKYGRGRREKKKGKWVVGITEVDDNTQTIDDQQLLQALMKREDERRRMAEIRAAKRKRRKRVNTDSAFSTSSCHFQVVEGPAPTFEEDASESEDEAEHRMTEAEICRLFSQARKARPKRTCFFVVDSRDSDTLTKIIKKFVVPGSIIYTDEWAGYNSLSSLGYQHKTICHTRRYSMFEFDDNTVSRITTNHIERMWVELRKTVKSMRLDQFEKYLNLESFRLLHLYGTAETNFMNTIKALTGSYN